MRIRIVHLWLLAVITYVIALFMAFSEELQGVVFFALLYTSLLISTKWADNGTH